jgi:hypothetical protein
MRLNVYLRKQGEGYPLPFEGLRDLEGVVREVQGHNQYTYPLFLSTGDIFNPEMKSASVEAYNQLPGMVAVYDPKAQLHRWIADFFTQFQAINVYLTSIVQDLEAAGLLDEVKNNNTRILCQLLGEPWDSAKPWKDNLATVTERLKRDRSVLEKYAPYAKPQGT